MAEVLDAEEGERQRIAEVLHESVLQDLLAARQDLGESLDEADGLTTRGRARLARADAGLTVVVAALRETSVLFAVLIGWLAFGERMDRTKAGAALLIVAGVALTRL